MAAQFTLMKGRVTKRRVFVQRARNELLTCAALAADENRRRCISNAVEHLVELSDLAALPDDSVASGFRLVPIWPGRFGCGEVSSSERFANDRANLSLIERLRDVVEGHRS